MAPLYNVVYNVVTSVYSVQCTVLCTVEAEVASLVETVDWGQYGAATSIDQVSPTDCPVIKICCCWCCYCCCCCHSINFLLLISGEIFWVKLNVISDQSTARTDLVTIWGTSRKTPIKWRIKARTPRASVVCLTQNKWRFVAAVPFWSC